MPACYADKTFDGETHICTRPAGHSGKHKCGQCGATW